MLLSESSPFIPHKLFQRGSPPETSLHGRVDLGHPESGQVYTSNCDSQSFHRLWQERADVISSLLARGCHNFGWTLKCWYKNIYSFWNMMRTLRNLDHNLCAKTKYLQKYSGGRKLHPFMNPIYFTKYISGIAEFFVSQLQDPMWSLFGCISP